jgi:hypothetical protein
VVAVAFALLGVWLIGRRRYTLPALGVAALAVYGLLDLDAASSSPDHLRGALHGGWRGLAAVAANRVPLAYDRMLHQWWLLIPLTGLAIAAGCALRTGARRDRALVIAMIGGMLASLLVNDSPGPVMIGSLAALLALEGGAINRVIAQPVLHRLVPPIAARPQEP